MAPLPQPVRGSRHDAAERGLRDLNRRFRAVSERMSSRGGWTRTAILALTVFAAVFIAVLGIG